MNAVPNSSAARTNILEIARRAGDHREYQVGGYVCIERKGNPWRVTTLAALTDAQATTENGYIYDRSTGRRLVPDTPSHDKLRPLTQDRIDSLVVCEFLDLAARLKYATCTDGQIQQLVPLAYSFLSTVETFDSVRSKRS